jgi:uncharacterized protein YjiS (DUF1127 family)
MRTAERKMELGLIAPQAAMGRQVAHSVVKGFVTFLRRIVNRTKANSLLDLDDHQLADIGLTRSDVRKALNLGLREDPTTRLAQLARIASVKAL